MAFRRRGDVADADDANVEERKDAPRSGDTKAMGRSSIGREDGEASAAW